MIQIKPYVKIKNLPIARLTVYTGYIIVTNDNKYLYAIYSRVNRLERQDAIQDAKKLKSELQAV